MIEEIKNNDVILNPDEKSENNINVNEKAQEISKELEDFTNEVQQEFDLFLSNKISIEETEDVDMVSTGIDLLDAILGGGIPLGRFVVIAGYPGGGKSTLAAKIIANLQEKYKEKCLAAYLDSEQTMSKQRLAELGVVRPKISPKSRITVEKVFELIEGICMFKEDKKIIDYPALVIWDSIANTPTEKDLTAKDINEVIGLKARILSIGLPKIVDKLAQYNITLLAINQLRDKMSIGLFQSPAELRYLPDKEMPGGQAVKFNAAQLLLLRHKQDLKKEQYGFNGASVVCRTIKNKFFTPNQEIDLALDFINGFSNFWTNYIFLANKKYIKTGAWNKLEGYDKNFRTREAQELYESDDRFKEIFDNLVQEAIEEHIRKPNTEQN